MKPELSRKSLQRQGSIPDAQLDDAVARLISAGFVTLEHVGGRARLQRGSRWRFRFWGILRRPDENYPVTLDLDQEGDDIGAVLTDSVGVGIRLLIDAERRVFDQIAAQLTTQAGVAWSGETSYRS